MANEEPASPTGEMTSTKAIVGGVIGAVAATLGSIQTALSDNVVSPSEWIGAAIIGLVTLGAVFTGTYYATNKPK